MKKLLFTIVILSLVSIDLTAHVVPGKKKLDYGKMRPYVSSWEIDLYHMQGRHIIKSVTPFRCKNGKKGFLVTDYQNNFLRHVENNFGQVATQYYKQGYVGPVKEYCNR